MSTLKTLLDAGAEVVGGTVNLGHVEMGRLRDGDLHLTDDGRAKLEELADQPEKARPAAKKTSKKAVKEAEPEANDPLDLNLDPSDFDPDGE